MPFSRNSLKQNDQEEIEFIASFIRRSVRETLRKKGAIVAVSGGIDSATCAALCARALGPENVLCLFLPERDSSPDSLRLGEVLAHQLGVASHTEPITEVLEKASCYARQDEAIRMVFPEYRSGWRFKISLPSLLQGERLNLPRLTIETPQGELCTQRMSATSHAQLVAATNSKQRVRKLLEYYHADRLHYAVCGTPNRLEYDQGFYVRGGDGLADFKPIAHLYKSQVYDLARTLGVPPEILKRMPTTDTFSLPQTQEEFYFALPYDKMDLCLYGLNHSIPATKVAPEVGLTTDEVERVFRDLTSKRRTNLPIQMPALLAREVPEIQALREEELRRLSSDQS